MALTIWGQVIIQAATPGEDPVKIGTLWVDISGAAAVKVCTAISPYTFAAVGGGSVAWGNITGTLSAQTDLQTALDAKTATTTFDDHSARHENNGADEISVAGLSGLLADSQTPLAHKTNHENNGSDEISVAGLSGLLADAQTALAGTARPTMQATTSTGTQNNFSLSANYTTLVCSNASALVLTGASVGGAAPADGAVLIIHNEGASTVRIAAEDSGSTADYRFDTPSTRGQIIGTDGTLVLVYEGGSVDRWHLVSVEPGKPISVAHNSGDFTASGSMTWTVESGDLLTFTYFQRGKVLTVQVAIEGSSTGGTAAGQLITAIPGGFTSTRTVFSPSYHKDDSAGFDTGAVSPLAGGTTLRAFTRTLANWDNSSTNNTNLWFTIIFEVD